MNPLLLLALEEAITALEPVVLNLVVAFVRHLATMVAPADFVSDATGIVTAIGAAHPDWPGEEKRDEAFAAIRVFATKRGATIADSQINALIEAAVAALKVPSIGVTG